MSTTALDISNPYTALARVRIREHEVELRDVPFNHNSLVVRMRMAGYEPLPLDQCRRDDIDFAWSLCCDRRDCRHQGLEPRAYQKPHSTLWYIICPICGAVREIVRPSRAPEGAVVL